MRVAMVISGLSEDSADKLITALGYLLDEYDQVPWMGKWKIRLFEDDEEVRGM